MGGYRIRLKRPGQRVLTLARFEYPEEATAALPGHADRWADMLGAAVVEPHGYTSCRLLAPDGALLAALRVTPGPDA